jgi:hypothetical protein
MTDNNKAPESAFNTIEDENLRNALNELGRSINLNGTYGKDHPVVANAIKACTMALQSLFLERKRVIIGSFNGVLTIDEVAVKTAGALLKSLERRLAQLQITGLRIAAGITEEELIGLITLLTCKEPEEFESAMGQSGMKHIKSENTKFQAVKEGQAVVDDDGMGAGGVLVLEDESLGGSAEESGEGGPNVHVDQIVAFLKGDIEADEDGLGEELAELASDPNRLGKLIMESVAVRQAASDLAGESLNDIILGCLRRTFNGIRKQPALQTSEGMADLRKSLLMLEESILDRLRDITGEPDPALDREIVQAIRQMDESLGFEIAARQYMEHREALNENAQQLQSFIQAQGPEAAEEMLNATGFPNSDWQKIVVESGARPTTGGAQGLAGLDKLASVFDKLENLMKSETVNGSEVKDLLGQATHDIDDTLSTTKEKLELLSKQLNEEDPGTIGGQGRHMSREELLAALAEVAQELMQPLTAINATHEMLMHGYVGKVTDDQLEMLKLASNSGEHLTHLMNMLIDIVGCPTNKGIDERYHTTSDEVIRLHEKEEHKPLRFYE